MLPATASSPSPTTMSSSSSWYDGGWSDGTSTWGFSFVAMPSTVASRPTGRRTAPRWAEKGGIMRKRVALPAGAALIASLALVAPGGAVGKPDHGKHGKHGKPWHGHDKSAKCGRES